jgi:hypothetical protein
MAGHKKSKTLQFRSAQEARMAIRAHLVVRFDGDETYPETDAEDRAYVKRIIAALNNTIGTKDYENRSGKRPQAYSKFADKLYPSELIEMQAWRILVSSKVYLVGYGGYLLPSIGKNQTTHDLRSFGGPCPTFQEVYRVRHL